MNWTKLKHVLCGTGLLVLTTSTLWAQEAAAASATEMTLLQLIKNGGIAMYPLGLFSIAVIALVGINAINLSEKKLLRPDLHKKIKREMGKQNPDGVVSACRDEAGMLPNVLLSGMERARGNEMIVEDIKEAMEESAAEQMMGYMRPINYLSTLGSVAPMVGLLGTVSGMIKAFQNIGQGGMGKPEVLGATIGEALVTTATGLIIAIPAMIAYFFFKSNFLKTMATMGKITGQMMSDFSSGYIDDEGSEEA